MNQNNVMQMWPDCLPSLKKFNGASSSTRTDWLTFKSQPYFYQIFSRSAIFPLRLATVRDVSGVRTDSTPSVAHVVHTCVQRARQDKHFQALHAVPLFGEGVKSRPPRFMMLFLP